MIFLPVVERELRVAARKRGTFWSRIAAAIVTLIFGAGILILMETVGGGNLATPGIGKFLFTALTWLSLATALFAGVFFTSDCLSEEKREGTIGFLFLTDLRGYDVVLGKLLATSLRGFYTFFAVLPVLAITLLMGGVTGQEFWRVCIALLSALFFSLAVGMFVSTFSREAQKALGGTLFLLIVLCGVGPVLDAYARPLQPTASLSSPIVLFLNAGWTGQNHFGKAILVNQMIALLLLGISCVVLPRTWQVKATKAAEGETWGRWWRYGSVGRRQRLRARLMGLNPVLWLVSRERWQSVALWIIALLSMGVAILVMVYEQVSFVWGYLQGVLTFALYLAVAADAGRFFVAARRSGLVELILATPLTVADIVRGHWRGLLRIYLVPVLVCMVIQVAGTVVSQQKVYRQMTSAMGTVTSVSANGAVIVTNNISGVTTTRAGNFMDQAWVARLMPYVTGALGLLTTVANLLALCWFGMWMGLTTKTSNFATLKTFVFVQVVPWFAISFASMLLVAMAMMPRLLSVNVGASWMLWYPLLSTAVTTVLCLAKDAAFILWSRRRLLSTFRTHATQTVLPYYATVPPRVIAQPPPLQA